MLTLNDGRSELWQWDTGRKLTVDADCTQVHFSNKFFGRSVDVDVVDGVAEIPDVLLQADKELLVWAFVGTAENGYTKISKVFKVNKRNKPADYVFTPPEQTTLQELVKRLDAIEESQDPDAIKNAVNEALAQAKASGEFKGDPGAPGEKGADGNDYVLTEADKQEIAEMTAPLVDVPEGGSNQPLTFTGAVNATYDGRKPVEVVIPQGGGGVTPTAAEKIVDYTVDASAATATAFAFTVAEYPKLAECNHLRGIVKKAVNGGMPWVQIALNATGIYVGTILGKAIAGGTGMLGFEITRSGEFFQGGMTAPTNTSLHNAWSNGSGFEHMQYRRLLPLQIAELTSVVVSSYQAFLDEGATIEIWGWNE